MSDTMRVCVCGEGERKKNTAEGKTVPGIFDARIAFFVRGRAKTMFPGAALQNGEK